MEIISLSIDEETLDKIEEITRKSSFNGRSELFRKAVENLHQEVVRKNSLKGDLNAVVVVRHPHNRENRISEISHSFDDVVTTQLHSKLGDEKCLEIFHVNGTADRVISFYNDLEGSKHTDSVSILPQNNG